MRHSLRSMLAGGLLSALALPLSAQEIGSVEAVRQHLIGNGVAATRLTARGYGPSQPKVANTTPESRAQNRRVELRRTN